MTFFKLYVVSMFLNRLSYGIPRVGSGQSKSTVGIANGYLFRVLNTVITDKIVTTKIT